MAKRVFLIVLDSLGIGAQPDAAQFGDAGANTLASLAREPCLHIPNLIRMGLGNIDGVACLPKVPFPTAAYGRLQEQSRGKDTTVGHWELAGLVSPRPLPTFPNGFPAEILGPFLEKTGRGVLANAPWSGTAVIEAYGEEHIKTGKLIVYTSADSVFQIAAHEAVVPPAQLYGYCRIARALLQGEYGVGRVIARPFSGCKPFYRTPNRRDFSLTPPGETLPDRVKNAGMDVIGVGKIGDIFAGQGITRSIHTDSNADGMAKTMALTQEDFTGLCFVNLVEFDMVYGHRRDATGYANALSRFDEWLGTFLPALGSEDALLLTADHGCDPGFLSSTDHTREYVPLLLYGEKPRSLGTGHFSDVAARVERLLSIG